MTKWIKMLQIFYLCSEMTLFNSRFSALDDVLSKIERLRDNLTSNPLHTNSRKPKQDSSITSSSCPSPQTAGSVAQASSSTTQHNSQQTNGLKDPQHNACDSTTTANNSLSQTFVQNGNMTTTKKLNIVNSNSSNSSEKVRWHWGDFCFELLCTYRMAFSCFKGFF